MEKQGLLIKNCSMLCKVDQIPVNLWECKIFKELASLLKTHCATVELLTQNTLCKCQPSSFLMQNVLISCILVKLSPLPFLIHYLCDFFWNPHLLGKKWQILRWSLGATFEACHIYPGPASPSIWYLCSLSRSDVTVAHFVVEQSLVLCSYFNRQIRLEPEKG